MELLTIKSFTMTKKITDFDQLILDGKNYLIRNLHYRAKSAYNYQRCWRGMARYMRDRNISVYSINVERKILFDRFKNRSISSLSRFEKEFYNGVKIFTEFVLTGNITISPRMVRNIYVFKGVVGKVISEYIIHKKGLRASPHTLRSYNRYLFQFNNYCIEKNLRNIKQVDLNLVVSYLRDISRRKGYPVGPILSIIRTFVKYLYDEKIILESYHDKIPKYKRIDQPKLPSTYSKKEINQLLKSVERFSAIGKRDYAVILMAARLGLRASDIACLKFENVLWDTSIIRLNQVKTGKELILPLLPDLGNAIIDYIKYGRHESEEPYIFLTQRPPYSRFESSNVVTHIVQRAFLKAGLATKQRRFGAHALRHTLGFRMLEESTVLPVISEVLGHKSTESTRYYLRIDLQSMKQCMLDVPAVPTAFYTQKGGIFYA
jgi:integrase